MPRQPSYKELFRVGDIVEVALAPLDGDSKPQWLRGKVIKINTLLHVRHGGPGHMAYPRAMYNRGEIRRAKGGKGTLPPTDSLKFTRKDGRDEERVLAARVKDKP